MYKTLELVRHRLAAFSQESTRYVDYSEDGKTKGNCQFIIPLWCKDVPEGQFTYKPKLTGQSYLMNDTDMLPINDLGTHAWLTGMQDAEDAYNELSRQGWTPQQARSVLPNSTKTEIVTTANFREWRHIFKMRTSNHAHPQIREVMIPLLTEFKQHLPELFDDIEVK
jgi:thymidylate synthase (FAD)